MKKRIDTKKINELISNAINFKIDNEIFELHDNCVRVDNNNGLLYIDGIVYDILKGYELPSLYNRIEKIIIAWVKSIGFNSYDFIESSVIKAY